jgi:hypothetical protein
VSPWVVGAAAAGSGAFCFGEEQPDETRQAPTVHAIRMFLRMFTGNSVPRCGQGGTMAAKA